MRLYRDKEDYQGRRRTMAVIYTEHQVKQICLVVRALGRLNQDLRSGKLELYIQSLKNLIDKGREDE